MGSFLWLVDNSFFAGYICFFRFYMLQYNMIKINGVLIVVRNDDIMLLKKNPTEFWEGVTSIVESAFSKCTFLENIELPNTVTSIGDYAFDCCFRLKSIKIPDSITSIGSYVFNRCAFLQKIEIPNTVTSIGYHAFDGLKNIEIANTVTRICDRAFADC